MDTEGHEKLLVPAMRWALQPVSNLPTITTAMCSFTQPTCQPSKLVPDRTFCMAHGGWQEGQLMGKLNQ
eukprot:2883635-Amphidinium_carterae.1